MLDVTQLARIDSFPYRHRLADVMTPRVLTGAPTLTLAEACQRMDAAATSSLVVVDEAGRGIGIVTERDLMRLLSRHHAAALDFTLGEIMSRPLKTLRADALLYVAIGRMTRLGLRHLAVVDGGERPVGVITGRALLKVRASDFLVIGDSIAEAFDAADLGRVRAALPKLAAGLLAEGVPAADVAAVISTVVRDMTGRAAELAEASLESDGWGPPPARWAVLVLGSGGRGESLLAFDQDNAIVHEGGPHDELWFAEAGRRINDMLAEAGLPYCDGEVMARNPAWRRSLAGWRDELFRWVHQPELQTIMYSDIFFDFRPVHGDVALAEELRAAALEIAGAAPFFLQFLSMHVAQMELPLGMLGQFLTVQGRFNAKKYGLLPLVSAARAKAVRAHIPATGTAERFAALTQAGLMHEDDRHDLTEIQNLLLRVILEQQLADLAAGRRAGTDIEPRRFDRSTQTALKAAFKRLKVVKALIGGTG